MRSLRFSERCHRAGGIRIAMAITVLLLLLVAPWLGVADVEDEPPPPQVDMGANLAPVRDWSTQLAFQDVFKMSRRFFTQNEGWVSGGKNPWDTGVIDQIPQDADGYPLELPYSVPGTPDDVPQIVKALMYRSLEGHYPTGHYVCLFDGTGTLDITGVTNEQLVAPGRYEFDELVPTDNGISVEILSSQLGDHVRNIRIFQEQFEDTSTQVWHPDFIANLQSFNVQSIRFMDWQGGNKPDPQTWADRSTATFQTQTTRKGVAVEHLVHLCHAMEVSPWFSMPYINDDDYNTQFATYVRDNLDLSLTIYLEWGNEAWNASGDIYQWIEDNKPAGLNHPEGYAYFADILFNTWLTVFAGQESRIVRVIGGQSGSPYQLQKALAWIFANGNGCDAGSIAHYVYADESSLTADSTIDELKAMMLQQVTDSLANRLENKTHCDTYGIPLLAYEGGQHLEPEPSGSEPDYLPLLQEMQTHPAIYDVYRKLLEQWDYDVAGGLWSAYSFCADWSHEGSNGFWGHLRYLDDVLAETPKWQALVDFSEPPQCPGDLNADNVIDTLDLVDFVACYGLPAVPGCEDADLNGDGTVNVTDLIDLLLVLGTACP